MPRTFADRLLDAVSAKRAPVVVALDPVSSRLPIDFAAAGKTDDEPTAAALEGIVAFSRRVLSIIAPFVPAVKINSAYFERYYEQGVAGYYGLVRHARQHGLLVIGDVKRGDVGHSAGQYAQAHLADAATPHAGEHATPDAITINGYFGLDGAQPFIDIARDQGKGLFVLVRTSNPSAAAVQDIVAQDGRRLHEVLAAEVARWAAESGTVGEHGYASIGAVVATRDPADAARLRAAMPQSIFLVPGYGAQGGSAEDFRPYFKPDGTGAVVAAGRSVIFAHQNPRYQKRFPSQWEKCVEQACRDFVADVRRIT